MKSLQYHTYDSMKKLLKSVHKFYPELTKLYSIGKSVEGRDLIVMEVTKKNSKSVKLKPSVKLVAGIHGDEAVGTEILIKMILFLVQNFHNDSSVR